MSWTPKFYLPQQQKVLMHKVFRALDNYAWKVAWLMIVEDTAATPLWNAYKASCQFLRPAKKRDLLSNPSDQLLIFLRFGSAMILHFQAAITMQCSKEGRNLVPYRMRLFMPTIDSWSQMYFHQEFFHTFTWKYALHSNKLIYSIPTLWPLNKTKVHNTFQKNSSFVKYVVC